MKRLFYFTQLTFASLFVISQTTSTNEPNTGNTSPEKTETRKIFKRKGNLYFSWGYNRAFFSHSDIRFWGSDYDFTIKDVTARDQPSHELGTYVNPKTMSIPQYNERFGFFLTDKTYITFGHDHMKYAIDRQPTQLTGYVGSGENQGTYDHTEVIVGDDALNAVYQPKLVDSLPGGFVTEFEHCDGLNDFSLEVGHLEQIWISKNGKHAFSAHGTIGAGMMIPDTDADVLGHEPKHDMETGRKAFHLAGYSAAAGIGLQFDFFRHFFILAKLKAGYINMPDIRTTIDGGKASQKFYFSEPMLLLGCSYPIFK